MVDNESGVNSEAVFAALERIGEYYFIHRLDRNTKGLLIFARNTDTETQLLAAFKEKRVEKRGIFLDISIGNQYNILVCALHSRAHFCV